jgi:hypothetical protein
MYLAQAWNSEVLYQQVYPTEDECIEFFGELNLIQLDEDLLSFLITKWVEN